MLLLVDIVANYIVKKGIGYENLPCELQDLLNKKKISLRYTYGEYEMDQKAKDKISLMIARNVNSETRTERIFYVKRVYEILLFYRKRLYRFRNPRNIIEPFDRLLPEIDGCQEFDNFIMFMNFCKEELIRANPGILH